MVQFLHATHPNQDGRGNSQDVERSASTATRSKSIADIGAFEGMEEYTALQKFITLYRDPRERRADADANAADARWEPN